MKKSILFILILSICFGHLCDAQDNDSVKSHHDFGFSGQLSGWTNITPDINTKGWIGSRYIPQINYGYHMKDNQLIDFEGSANLYGELGIVSLNNISADAKIKPYRLWTRFSNTQNEFRIGLQKINFGSAQMFRPLMWFDKMDPRDPLQMTDGVWAMLYRHYFTNNANIWLWTLGGNKDIKGWELLKTSGKFQPEIGGRFQIPLTNGESAFSYHYRMADISTQMMPISQVEEHKFGLDVRADITVGLWFESAWTYHNKDIGLLTNQNMITVGSDYTFPVGNGIGITAEHMIYGMSKKAFNFDKNTNFTGLALNYPVTLFDNINTMIFYDWDNNHVYSFINWQKQFNNISFYLMGYWNPTSYNIPGQSNFSRFAGKGIQIMVVWNH